jgi:hypothetical protein
VLARTGRLYWCPACGRVIWMGEGSERSATLKQLQSLFPWFQPLEGALLHERDPALYVEMKWQQYESAEPDHVPCNLQPLICEAGRFAVLRRLLPFTSLNRLCLSRTTGYPFACSGCPHAYPVGENRYRVIAPSPAAANARHEAGGIVGEGNASEAAALLAAVVGENCGAAIDGTEEDLS